MCLLCCDVRIKSTWQGGIGVSQWPTTQRRTPECYHPCHTIRRDPGEPQTRAATAIENGVVPRASGLDAEGMQSPGGDNQTTGGDRGSEDLTFPTTNLRPLWNGKRDWMSGEWPRWWLEEASHGTNLGRSTTRPCCNDTRYTRIWRGGKEFADAACQCPNCGSEGIASCSPRSEDRGQNFSDSLDCSGSDHTQFRGWIVQHWIVIRPKPSSFPNKQFKMLYTFNSPWGQGWGQILPHIRESRTIGLKDLPAFINLLKAAFGDPDQVTTRERKMRDIMQMNPKLSQYHAAFEVISADLDFNPSAIRNTLQMGFSQEMKDSFTNSGMPEELAEFLILCQKWDNQIWQRRAEKAAQKSWGVVGFASSPRPPIAPNDPAAALSGSVPGFPALASLDLSAGKRRISAAERAKRFVDRMCL